MVFQGTTEPIASILPILGSLALGVLFFLLGFFMVYSSLKRVNRIEGEKFTRTDWSVCIGFGVMFALPLVFGINLGVQAIRDNLTSYLSTTFHINFPPIPQMSDYISLILFIELLVLFIYPFWEMLYLARPTSDAVTSYHKWLESTFVDRVGGKGAYGVSLGLYFINYICPAIVLALILNKPFSEMLFLWILIIPLFFLNYFAASGQAQVIIRTIHTSWVPRKDAKKFTPFQTPTSKMMSLIRLALAIVPVALSVYTFLNPIIALVQSGNSQTVLRSKTDVSALISLVTTIGFGIVGFFD